MLQIEHMSLPLKTFPINAKVCLYHKQSFIVLYTREGEREIRLTVSICNVFKRRLLPVKD